MPVPLRVLILEDRQTDLDMMVYELKRAGFDPHLSHALDAAEYASRLSPHLDVILADYSLPQFDALAALKILQERNLHTPFIVVTGSISEEAAVACLKAGATDYLLKDRLARLGPAITQALESRKNLEAKIAAEEEIRRRNRELTVLNRIIAVSAESGDERVFLQTACDELSAATGALCVLAFVINAERTQFSVYAERGAHPSLTGRVFSYPKSPMGKMISTLSEPLVMNDAERRPRSSGATGAFSRPAPRRRLSSRFTSRGCRRAASLSPPVKPGTSPRSTWRSCAASRTSSRTRSPG